MLVIISINVIVMVVSKSLRGKHIRYNYYTKFFWSHYDYHYYSNNNNY